MENLTKKHLIIFCWFIVGFLPKYLLSYTLLQELAGYVKIPFPKLKITEGWINRNTEFKLPANLSGKTISILGIINGKTLIANDENIVFEINGILKGDYSFYEERLREYYKGIDIQQLKDIIKAEPVETPSFESLGLPTFASFVGAIKSTKGVSVRGAGGSFSYHGLKNAIRITSWSNWTKDELETDSMGTTTATFTIPIEVTNITGSAIKNFLLNFYLEGSEGKRYFPKEKIQIEQLIPFNELKINVQVKAPADDFSLLPYLEDGEHRLKLDGPFQINWEEEALKKQSRYYLTMDIASYLTEWLKFTSTKGGYNRVLSRLSFLYIRKGQYEQSLSILNNLLEEETDSSITNFAKFQKIIALIKLHKLKSALIKLGDATSEIMPIYYIDYLARCCLRQIEREEILDSIVGKEKNIPYVEIIKKIRTKIMDDFKANVMITPFIQEDDIKEKVKSLAFVQGQYEELKELYIQEKNNEAKIILFSLIESGPEEIVFYRGRGFRVGPAGLDILGRIYLRENNVPAAMNCFKKMVDQYCNDYFYGPYTGEAFYGGPAGAQGMVYQLGMLTKVDWSGLPNITELEIQDYDKAIQLAHLLIKKFDGVPKPCYEDGSNYEEVAAYYIKTCLEEKNAPLKRWEEEIRKILHNTKNEYLAADLLLTLAKKNTEFGDTTNTIKIYEEVIGKYSELYFTSALTGEFRVYCLEACQALIELYTNRGNVENELQKVKNKMKNNYDEIRQVMTKKGPGYVIEELEKRFGEYVK